MKDFFVLLSKTFDKPYLSPEKSALTQPSLEFVKGGEINYIRMVG